MPATNLRLSLRIECIFFLQSIAMPDEGIVKQLEINVA